MVVAGMLYGSDGSEPFLVGFRPVGITYQLQIAVLAVSTVILSIGHIVPH